VTLYWRNLASTPLFKRIKLLSAMMEPTSIEILLKNTHNMGDITVKHTQPKLCMKTYQKKTKVKDILQSTLKNINEKL
jgi:hypothetical protein